MDTAKSYICPNCGKTFYGRSNKIFCSDNCRIQYANEKRKKAYFEKQKNDLDNKISVNSNDTEEPLLLTKLTIVSDNKVIINIIKQICSNNNVKVRETTREALPLMTPDKDGNFYMDGKMLYTSNMIAQMLNTESRWISTYANNASIYPIARGPVARNPQANLYSEDDVFKLMEILSEKNK